MSDVKHTPGPWAVAGRCIVADPSRDGRVIASVDVHEFLFEQRTANGSLMAAAPDLLDALIECEDYFDQRADADCDQYGFVPNKEMRLLTVVRAAIAKAGQS